MDIRTYLPSLIIGCFLSIHLPSFSQVSDVKKSVEESYEYYQSAYSKISNAKAYIQDCFNASSVSDIQYYAGLASSEVDSAKRELGYAEDEADDAEREASSLNCYDAKRSAGNAESYFYDAQRKLSDASSDLSSATYTDDTDYLSDYLNNANDYIRQAINMMSDAVDALNDTLKNISSCGVPTNTNSYGAASSSVSCENLLNYITSNGYRKGSLSNYTLDSSWLYEVTAYAYEYDIYVVAKIKENEYSYQTKTYIFCGIPSQNWNNFKNGAYGDPKSFGERFHKYIFDYQCECY